MKLISEKVQVNQNQSELFSFLSDYKNFEQLMPENTKSFRLHESEQGFYVQVGALPEVGMRWKESNPNDTIIFESPNESFQYELKVNLESNQDLTNVWIDFDGKFNPMIEMMAKSPLQNFINSIVQNVQKLK